MRRKKLFLKLALGPLKTILKYCILLLKAQFNLNCLERLKILDRAASDCSNEF